MSYIIRRRKLGKTSTEGIRNYLAGVGVNLPVILNGRDALPVINEGYVFRWGCTAEVGHRNIVNTSRAIHWANDKLSSRKELADAGLAPITATTPLELDRLQFPVVVRPRNHSRGLNLWAVNDMAALRRRIGQLGQGNWYASNLVDKVSEHRVFVCSGRVVWVAQKTPGNPQDIAWNVARGGRFDNVRWGDWNRDMLSIAIRATEMSGLDFAGVDIMTDANGRHYVLELNSAPSQTSPYRQSCVAKVFRYIMENGKDTIPLGSRNQSTLDYIHPALNEEARVA